MTEDRLVDKAVLPEDSAHDPAQSGGILGPYDISKIDFERLRQEFAKHLTKQTDMMTLKTIIDRRVQRMIQENPGRTDYQQRFQEIIDAYNHSHPEVEARAERVFAFVFAQCGGPRPQAGVGAP